MLTIWPYVHLLRHNFTTRRTDGRRTDGRTEMVNQDRAVSMLKRDKMTMLPKQVTNISTTVKTLIC